MQCRLIASAPSHDSKKLSFRFSSFAKSKTRTKFRPEDYFGVSAHKVNGKFDLDLPKWTMKLLVRTQFCVISDGDSPCPIHIYQIQKGA